MTKDPYTKFAEFIARKKLKMTPQRRRILEVFLSEEGHVTSEELYQKVKREYDGIGQATVYRTLKLLADSGLAKAVEFGDGALRYEILYGQSHHDHLICECCGINVEVVDPSIERLQEEVARRHGFKLTAHKLYLYGICPDCQKKASGNG
ncbi:ferric uptake regulator, Fur family [Solidesulfovibrio fructosivorans JJ]]|uniref:Ferric uptake regulation protein n=1 Tax=Solidesulfovibrio fructosivorans JJ] TaxID=596151 RepID=E1K1K7_SOLFR|nr:Fur family transcriptional regulator [Solidesulfovibrio fructosivorans]EFL49501.1 ferric uptake regulator, Fur family [Solidesulfovibrio fructosivorans JJ]]